MKNGSILGRKTELFHEDLKRKKDIEQILKIQTYSEFNQNETNIIKYIMR